MCEITEAEYMERRLESLRAEIASLRFENAQLDVIWRDVNRERCGLRAEVERLKQSLASEIDARDHRAELAAMWAATRWALVYPIIGTIVLAVVTMWLAG